MYSRRFVLLYIDIDSLDILLYYYYYMSNSLIEMRMYKLLYGGKYDNTNKLNTITNNPNHNHNNKS